MIFCRISSPYDSRVPSCTDVFLQHTAGEAWQGRFVLVVGSLEKAQNFGGSKVWKTPTYPGWWFQPTPLKNDGVRQLG